MDCCVRSHASKYVATGWYSLSQGSERLIIFLYVASDLNLVITKCKKKYKKFTNSNDCYIHYSFTTGLVSVLVVFCKYRD